MAFAIAFCAPFLVAEAQIFRIPQDGSPMPNYWSGTNCRASASCDLIVEPIGEAELWLNGELVYYWHWLDSGYAPWNKSVKVMFDSSHFDNETPVSVTFKVWGFSSGWLYSYTSSAPLIKNRLMMFEDPAPPTPDPVPTVNSLMSGKHFYMWTEDGPNWSEGTYFGILFGSTAVFAAGHGAPAVHTSPVGTGMVPAQYLYWRESMNGSGLPPFNSTVYPPVNFCHLVACNCGDTINFRKVLYPYYMGWGGPELENQALLAYTVFTSQSHRAKNAELIWQKLAVGWTARATLYWMENTWLPQHAGQDPIALPMSDVDDPPVWRDAWIGDFNLICGPDGGAMRLKTVYTGNHTPPTSFTTPWFWVFKEIVEG